MTAATQKTRDVIRQLLAAKPRTRAELSEVTMLDESAVRYHLDLLAAAGRAAKDPITLRWSLQAGPADRALVADLRREVDDLEHIATWHPCKTTQAGARRRAAVLTRTIHRIETGP